MQTYSRYIPNGKGGFLRTVVPDPPPSQERAQLANVHIGEASPVRAAAAPSDGSGLQKGPGSPSPPRKPPVHPGNPASPLGPFPNPPGNNPHRPAGIPRDGAPFPSHGPMRPTGPDGPVRLDPPPSHGPGRPMGHGPFPPHGPAGPGGTGPPLSLRRLLPADTDLEDLLILAILVLLLMEEGESATVILCAVLAYFVLGRLEDADAGPLPLPGLL